ncbi:MAG: DUF4743 domain-containing protein [Burkholderiaceae bacterium]|nr:DUF4743 domain-containing protein [Burkholderiaceae bacterium]
MTAGHPSPEQRAFLIRLLAGARRPVPRDWLPLCLGGQAIGALAPLRVAPLLAVLPGCSVQGQRLAWASQDLAPEQRSQQIQQAAERLRELGLIAGWRNEAYRCEAPVGDPLVEQGAELFRLERAAFRFFGLRSRAVHINGFSSAGGLWCGRRALNKATDPGRLDNLAAGGLPAGESFESCAIRELGEEAGVEEIVARTIAAGGAVRCTRVEAEGLHDEVLHVYNLALPPGFAPRNQDGEVAEFLHLPLAELMARLQAGQFTEDASAVIAAALLGRAECPDGEN